MRKLKYGMLRTVLQFERRLYDAHAINLILLNPDCESKRFFQKKYPKNGTLKKNCFNHPPVNFFENRLSTPSRGSNI
jgi:hypothetical protein